MRKKTVVALLILMAGTVSAQSVSIDPIDREATSEQPAVFDLKVQNNGFETERYRISSIRSPEGTFSYNRSITVEPGETESFELKVRSGEYTVTGNYRFNVNVRTINGAHVGTVDDYFKVVSDSDILINSLVLQNDMVRPGDNLELSLETVNVAPSERNYQVKVSVMDQEFTSDGQLSSGGTEAHEFSIPISPGTEPGEKTIKLQVLQEETVERDITRTVSIQEFQDFSVETQTEDRVFEYTTKITLVNTGNVGLQSNINQSLPRYIEPLATFSHSYDRIEEQGASNIYFWDVDLSPGQQDSVEYTVRYWPPLIVLALIIIGVKGLKTLQTPVKFTKTVREDEDGLKVHVKLENHTNRLLEGMEVKDFVPDVASVGEEFPMAKPVIRKTSDGTRLNWDIESMEPGEERIFEYRIKPLIEVEGGAVLPEAEITKNGEHIAETKKVETGFNL